MYNFVNAKSSAFRAVSLGITFICCSLIIYRSLQPIGGKCKVNCSSSRTAGKLKNQKCKSYCTTSYCVEIANNIIKDMNLGEEPCHDFHSYTCGNFREKYGPNISFSFPHILSNVIDRIIRDIIESTKETEQPDSIEQKVKTVYDSCMDTRSSELLDFQSLQSFLNETGVINWPYLNSNFTFANPSLEDILGSLLFVNENIFFGFSRKERNRDDGSGELYDFFVDVPKRSYYNSTDEDLKYMVDAILRYSGIGDEQTKSVWKSFLAVESALSELYDINRNVSISEGCQYWNVSLGEYIYCKTEEEKNMNMMCKVLKAVVEHAGLSSRYTNERLFVPCGSAHYIKELSIFLNSHNPRDIAHYIALSVFFRNLQYMNFFLRKSGIKFAKQRREIFGETYVVYYIDKWRTCIDYFKKNMVMPLGLMYVTEIFTEDSVNELNDLMEVYKGKNIELLRAQNNTSENATSKVIERVLEMKNHITDYIKEFQNRTEITKAYEMFYPVKNNFIINVMNNKKRRFLAKHLGNYEMEDSADWHDMKQIFETNAISNPKILLLLGFLVPPLYKHEYPKAFKLARLGEIMGHEIGHSFYSEYSYISYLNEDNKTKTYMDENLKCRAAQYSEFEMKLIGKKVVGNLTDNEDFSDVVGNEVSESIFYDSLRNTTDKLFALPGLEFSVEQLFYIFFAQYYCQVRSIELERRNWKNGGHSLDEFRVHGVLQSSQKFSQVFNCPTTSFMNPQQKCPVFY